MGTLGRLYCFMSFFGRAVQPPYVSRYPSHEITTLFISEVGVLGVGNLFWVWYFFFTRPGSSSIYCILLVWIGLGIFTLIMANMPHVTLSLAQCWALFISSGAKGVITVFPRKLQIVPCIQNVYTARNRIPNKLNKKRLRTW